MKNKGRSLSGPLMLTVESRENFVGPMSKIFQIVTFWGSGVWRSAIFTAKGTSLRQSTLFEPFCVKIGSESSQCRSLLDYSNLISDYCDLLPEKVIDYCNALLLM